MLYPKDSKVKVAKSDHELKISWRIGQSANWIGSGIFILIPLLAFLTLLFDSSQSGQGMAFWTFVALAVFSFPIAYVFAAYAWNTSEIVATKEKLSYSCEPVTWCKSVERSSRDVVQFFTKPGYMNPQTAQTSCLHIYFLDSDHHAHLFCGGLPSTFAAHQIVRELHMFYELDDVEVYGETNMPHHPGINL